MKKGLALIRYQVSKITKNRIKELAKLWKVTPGTVVELSIHAAYESGGDPQPLQRQMDRMESLLLSIFPEEQ